MIHSGAWGTVLRILRDPIFGLAFAIFLTFLGSRHVRRLVRTIFWLAAIVILIWLAAHNASSAHVELAVVTAITRVLLILIAVLFLVALIALAVLLVMYLKTAPPSSSLLGEGPALRARTSFIGDEIAWPSASEPRASSLGDEAGGDVAERLILEESGHFSAYLDGMTRLLEGLLGSVDSDNLARVIADVMRIYFSGLSVHSGEIRRVHEKCNASVARTAKVLAEKSYRTRLPLRNMSNENWFPTSGEWAAVTEHAELRFPYLVLRVICLKADWRVAAMIMYKSYACLALLMQLDEV
jgi:hypothetical protein